MRFTENNQEPSQPSGFSQCVQQKLTHSPKQKIQNLPPPSYRIYVRYVNEGGGRVGSD